MEVLCSIWLFIQNQVLEMKWLNTVIGNGFSVVDWDTSTWWGQCGQRNMRNSIVL